METATGEKQQEMEDGRSTGPVARLRHSWREDVERHSEHKRRSLGMGNRRSGLSQEGQVLRLGSGPRSWPASPKGQVWPYMWLVPDE